MFCSTKLADSFDLLLQGFTLVHLDEQKALIGLNEMAQQLQDINQKLVDKNQEDKK
jgi:hypothetical protein